MMLFHFKSESLILWYFDVPMTKMFVADGKLIDQTVDCLKKYLQLSSYLLRLQPVAFESLKLCNFIPKSHES